MINGLIQFNIADTNADILVDVNLARTQAELVAGYSNLTSPPSGTGILFDIGGRTGAINSVGIDLSKMLFNLDIYSIDEIIVADRPTHKVTAIQRNLAPRTTGITVTGVRYFVEMESGYSLLSGLKVGDRVTFETKLETDLAIPTANLPVPNPTPTPDPTNSNIMDITPMISMMIALMMVVMMMKMMSQSTKALSTTSQTTKSLSTLA